MEGYGGCFGGAIIRAAVCTDHTSYGSHCHNVASALCQHIWQEGFYRLRRTQKDVVKYEYSVTRIIEEANSESVALHKYHVNCE